MNSYSLVNFLILPIVSYFGCQILAYLLIKKRIVARPTDRCNHTKTIPVGIGVFLAFLILYSLIYNQIILKLNYNTVIVGIFVLGIISFLDDIKKINFFWRLLIHITICSLAVLNFPVKEPFFHGLFPLYIDNILTILLYSWFVNLYNFMDGIDGITSTETIFITISTLAVGMTIAVPDIYILSMIILLTVIGFLPHNWPPARMFLGDSGSITLGFATGWLLLYIAKKGFLPAALIIPAYYLADSGVTIIKRIIFLEKIWQPHSKHFFQMAVRKGRSHLQVLSLIIFCNINLSIFAIIATIFPQIKFACFGAAILLVSYQLMNLAS